MRANLVYGINSLIRYSACGHAGYASKLRLGCSFLGNTVFFRHRHPVLNHLRRLVKIFIRPDRTDPAMATAISEQQ